MFEGHGERMLPVPRLVPVMVGVQWHTVRPLGDPYANAGTLAGR